MNSWSMRKTYVGSLCFLLLICVLPACQCAPASSGSEPRVWIDAPTNGLSVPVDQAIQIEGHAVYNRGLARIEVWVNGELHLIEEAPVVEDGIAWFSQSWMPPGAGDYQLQAVAVGNDGATGDSDVVGLQVTVPPTEVPTQTPTPTPVPATDTPEATATLTPTATYPPPPPPTDTPEPTSPPPAASVKFWVDDDPVKAGSCTKLRWRVENVQSVFLDDKGVVGVGSKEICPCSKEKHKLTVVLLDGTKQEHYLTVHVQGDCPTETPKATNPPPK